MRARARACMMMDFMLLAACFYVTGPGGDYLLGPGFRAWRDLNLAIGQVPQLSAHIGHKSHKI